MKFFSLLTIATLALAAPMAQPEANAAPSTVDPVLEERTFGLLLKIKCKLFPWKPICQNQGGGSVDVGGCPTCGTCSTGTCGGSSGYGATNGASYGTTNGATDGGILGGLGGLLGGTQP